MPSTFLRYLRLLPTLLLVFLLGGCGGSETGTNIERALVVGQVVQGGIPQPNILVVDLVTGDETSTNSDGAFSLSAGTTVLDEVGLLVENTILSLGQLPEGASGFSVEIEISNNTAEIISQEPIFPERSSVSESAEELRSRVEQTPRPRQQRRRTRERGLPVVQETRFEVEKTAPPPPKKIVEVPGTGEGIETLIVSPQILIIMEGPEQLTLTEGRGQLTEEGEASLTLIEQSSGEISELTEEQQETGSQLSLPTTKPGGLGGKR